jgi:hypothetical protein
MERNLVGFCFCRSRVATWLLSPLNLDRERRTGKEDCFLLWLDRARRPCGHKIRWARKAQWVCKQKSDPFKARIPIAQLVLHLMSCTIPNTSNLVIFLNTRFTPSDLMLMIFISFMSLIYIIHFYNLINN